MPTVYIVTARHSDQASIAEPIVYLPKVPGFGTTLLVLTHAGPMQCGVRGIHLYEPPHRLLCGTQIDAAIVVEPVAPGDG